MSIALPPSLHLCRLSERSWDLRQFRAMIKELSELPRPKEMTQGLWELPLYEDASKGWQPTEFYPREDFYKMGGVKAFEKLHFSEKLAPCFQWAMDLKLLGLSIYRLRLLALAPDSTQHKHIDQISEQPILRLHLPLLTHSQAFLDYFNPQDQRFRYHLQADGHGYLINVAHTHRVCNLDHKKWRIHLVCDLRSMNTKLQLDQLQTATP